MKYCYRFFIIFIAVLFLGGCSVFGIHRKHLPPLPKFKTTLSIHKQWSVNAGVGTAKKYLRLTPVIAAGKVFTVSYNGQVTAVDANSGRRVWTVNVRYPITSGIAASNGMLYFATGNGVGIALRQSNGAMVWKDYITHQILATPTISGNVALFKSMNDTVTAVNASNGKKMWEFQQQTPQLILRASSSVQVSSGYVVAGFANGQLVILSLQSGKVIWKQPVAVPQGGLAIERMIDIDGTPLVAGGNIYVATYQGNISALKLRTGRVLWRHNISAYTGLALGPQRIFLTASNGDVLAYDKATGGVVWQQNGLHERELTGPAVVGNALVFADAHGYVHWVARANGAFLARIRVNKHGVTAAPLVWGNRVYVYTNSGRLVMYVVG